jgi:mannonate dehydratase
VSAEQPGACGARGAEERGEAMIRIAEHFGPDDRSLQVLSLQCGVTSVVAGINLRPRPAASKDGQPWSLASLTRARNAYEQAGFRLEVIESRPPMEKIKLGLPGREQELAAVAELLSGMGRLGIPVWCYEWMPVLNWVRTSTTVPTRGGALATGFDLAEVKDPPITEYGEVTEDRLWENLGWFLERIVPAAEKAGVKLAMHPDDPPVSPLRGMARIMRSIDNFQRLLDLVSSPVNGIALCQGNFALMTDDLPAAIRRFGAQRKIFFVHLRDVRGKPDRFVETFHDDGQTNMASCIRAYRDVGFDGPARPDHVPTMVGDRNERPGYSSIGRLFAIGYLKGLVEAVYSEQRPG